MLAPRSVRRLKIENGTSGRLLRSSITTNAASRTAAPTSRRIVAVDVQPALSASTSAKTSSASPAVTANAPGRSNVRSSSSPEVDSLRRRGA